MNIIDTSGWLEYFTDGKNADFFSKPILDKSKLIIVPVVIIYEVFKKVLIEAGEDKALETIGQFQKYKIENIDDTISLSAAKISYKNKIPMADSIIYAVTLKYDAILWTQDEYFEKLRNVKYIRK
ncbi:type II toxin-antitoxin system VapC family toxin [Candidatus Dependentiae bacterium]|nr:type II toxin-antitoxin system VapC family toxin [Candidatus Dependentiae bacterium]